MCRVSTSLVFLTSDGPNFRDDVVHEICVSSIAHTRQLAAELIGYDRLSPFCRVVEASHGQEALKLLDRIRPNLILSDVVMPGACVTRNACRDLTNYSLKSSMATV